MYPPRVTSLGRLSWVASDKATAHCAPLDACGHSGRVRLSFVWGGVGQIIHEATSTVPPISPPNHQGTKPKPISRVLSSMAASVRHWSGPHRHHLDMAVARLIRVDFANRDPCADVGEERITCLRVIPGLDASSSGNRGVP